MPTSNPTLRHAVVAGALPCLLPQPQALAQSSMQAARLEPLTVTASRFPEPAVDSLRDVTILDAADIAAAGASDLVQLLARVPGLQWARPGPFATPSVFLRGHNANQTLILVDGQRIASSFSGLAALQNLGPEQIERIEIVRGPHAGLWGADAMGGVINIITRPSAADGRVQVVAGGGADRGVTARATAGFASGATRLEASAGYERSDGYNAIVDPRAFSYNPDRDGWRVSRASLGLTHTAGPNLTAFFRLNAGRSDSQYDGSKTYDDRVEVDLSTLQAGVRWHGANGQSELTVGQGREASTFDSTFAGRYVVRNTQAAWIGRLALSPAVRASAALEARREKVDDSDGLPVKARETKSATFTADWNASPVRAAATLRVDDGEQAGTRTTGSLSFGWQPAPGWRLTLHGGTAFKLPTFNDLYYPGFSNPKLRPETSRSGELRLAWRDERAAVSITAYRAEVRDLIQFICDANFNCAPQNIARARLTGATIDGNLRLGDVRLSGSFDLLDPRNRSNDRLLPRRAREFGQLGVAVPVAPSAEVALSVRGAGRRFDDAANRNALAGYAVLDLATRWQIAPNWRLEGRIDNALDRDYQTARGYSTGGRRWQLQLAATF